MATKATATAEKTEIRTESTDSPLLDGVTAAVKKLVAKGKERGYITIDELNAAMPPDDAGSEQIEDMMTMLSEMGVNVVENEDSEDGAEKGDRDDETGTSVRTSGNLDDDDIGRTDDPVRMYLREMGSVELLSREGEIAVAKRIEAGREKMIGALCESPLTMRAITQWHDALVDEEILLRDVINLDTTYGGGPETGFKVVPTKDATAVDKDEDEDEKDAEDDKDDEDENEDSSVSLAQMELELKPEVLKTFQNIASTYAKLKRAQDKRLNMMQRGDEVSKSTERTYEKHKRALIQLMEKVHLNNHSIEQLVEQLYDLNRELTRSEGRVLRLAIDLGLDRQAQHPSLGAGQLAVEVVELLDQLLDAVVVEVDLLH